MEEIIKKCLPTYEVVRKIGSGVYGVVYLVRDNLKERAVKIVPIQVERSFSYRTKTDLDSKISHDFYAVQEYYHKIKGDGVIEIYDFHLMDKQVTKQEARAYLVILMEYCPANLLDRVLDHYPLPGQTALTLMQQLAKILKRLSDRSQDAFIVKDLKPSNLLIDNNQQLIVGDLGGLQRISSMSTTTNAQFTPNWSAPELITHSGSAGVASLIFSYGFVAYFIWSGALPYEKSNFSERLRRIREKGIDFKRRDIPTKVRNLIRQCLQFKPEDRPADFDEILQRLDEASRQPVPRDHAEENASTASKPAKSATGRSGRKKTQAHTTQGTGKKSRPKNSGPHQIGDTWVEPITGMEFVWVPTGAFKMGSGAWDGEGKKDEQPVHEVFVDGFWLGRYPVTQAIWKQVMANSLWLKVRGGNPSWFKMGGQHPVEQVSWHDAQDFCQKLISMNKGRYHFRLPTEAEWEYAARSGGKPEKYPGGKVLDDVAWYSANSGMTTQPVGGLAPNGLGAYDMSGNVYEWCADFYHEDAYRQHDYNNPCHLHENNRRVIRGGSWCNFPSELRCSYRASVNADFKGNYLGLRLVMTPVSRKRHH